MRFAALLHDAAKPRTRGVRPDGRVTFVGHDRRGRRARARRRCGGCARPQRLADYVAALTRHHLRLGFLVHERPLSRRVGLALPERDGARTPPTSRLHRRRPARHARPQRRPAIAAHLELAREMLARRRSPAAPSAAGAARARRRAGARAGHRARARARPAAGAARGGPLRGRDRHPRGRASAARGSSLLPAERRTPRAHTATRARHRAEVDVVGRCRAASGSWTAILYSSQEASGPRRSPPRSGDSASVAKPSAQPPAQRVPGSLGRLGEQVLEPGV